MKVNKTSERQIHVYFLSSVFFTNPNKIWFCSCICWNMACCCCNCCCNIATMSLFFLSRASWSFIVISTSFSLRSWSFFFSSHSLSASFSFRAIPLLCGSISSLFISSSLSLFPFRYSTASQGQLFFFFLAFFFFQDEKKDPMFI